MVALIDWDTQMIYDRFHIMILILAVFDFLLYPERGIVTRLIGALIISVPMLILALVIPGAFGGGDIKLMAASGLLLGHGIYRVRDVYRNCNRRRLCGGDACRKEA